MLNDARIGRLHELLRARELSAAELTTAALDRINTLNAPLNTFITVTPEQALDDARTVDRRIGAGEEISPLAGIPAALQDNICTAGTRTTCASQMLADYVSPFDAAAAERLRAAGTVLTGKLNLDEFTLGTSTATSHFGPAANPWDPARRPGGTAAAAAVAARQVGLAVGSDAGGMLRLAAAYCGVVGLKPTYGLIPTHGLVECAPSLEHLGTLTVDVTGAALALSVLAGADSRDPMTAGVTADDYPAALDRSVKDLVVGVPREYLDQQLDPEVRAAFDAALARLEALGARVDELSLPHTAYAPAAHLVLWAAEAFSNLSNFDGVRFGHRAEARHLHEMYRRTRREGFGPHLRRLLVFGTLALSAGHFEEYFVRAQKVRTLVCRDFDAAFARCDVLAVPTTPAPAPAAGAPGEADGATPDPHAAAVIPANLAGLPALSLPVGLADGVPAGLQLIGPAFGESVLLAAAHALEQEIGFYRQSPPAVRTEG